MKVYCLTTKHNEVRQAQILKDWDGWQVVFIHGPDWRDFPCEGYERVFGLTCCMCGHLKMWRQLKHVAGWKVIIEDDALPLVTIHEAIQEIENQDVFNVVKMYHPEVRSERGIFPLSEFISTAAYMVKDTKRLMNGFQFQGSPDRTLARIARVAGIFPIAAQTRKKGSTIKHRWNNVI